MKKKNLSLVSLWVILLTFQYLPALAQSPGACGSLIQQKDSTVCPGVTLHFNLIPPPSTDSLLPGVWKQLISGSAIDSNLFNIKPFGYDKARQWLYSIIHKKIIRYDLKTNTVISIPANNWPGDFTEFVYDYTNRRILCWRGGRDSVYAIPDTGGNWVGIGGGAVDREMYGSSAFWNPLTQEAGLYGGYGFNTVKSWIYENNAVNWIEKKPNPAIDSVPPKGGNILAANSDGTKLYLFSGQGNYSGDELAGTCSLGSPWATANGMFCWLRDLWELDLNTYQFTNILPVNNQSIQYEGVLTYYYDKTRFYLFGGYQPTGDAATNLNLPNTNKTFYFRKGIDSGFVEFHGEGTVPPALPKTLLNNYAYYDPVGKRMIWARFDGIWAYYPDSTNIPPATSTTLWSTGDTASSITVKPVQTTVYYVTKTNGANVCKDSVKITVTDMRTNLQHDLPVCGDSAILDAGAGFATYQWSTGETTSSIMVKQNATYAVAFTKAGCSATDTSRVKFAIPVTDFSIGKLKDSVCSSDKDSLYVVFPQTGINYNWVISGNTGVVHTGTDYQPVSLLNNTTYTVTGSSDAVICPVKTATATIVVRTKLATPVLRADSVGLYNLVFAWDPVPGATGYLVSTDGGNSFNIPQTGPLGLKQIISGLLPNQSATIQVKATGPYACQESSVAVLTDTTLNPFGDGIYVPNAFTPNGDGINDQLRVYGTAIVSVKLIIYNQWGREIFVSTDLLKGWDGLYHGSNQPAGLYSYSLEAIMQNGRKINKGGTFHLIR